MRRSEAKSRNGAKSYTFTQPNLHPFVSLCQRLSFVLWYTSQQIWDRMLLSCLFQNGQIDLNFLNLMIVLIKTTLDLWLFQRLPFDWKNPLGYLIAACLQYVMTKCFFIYVASLSSFGIGFYLFSMAMSEDMKLNLNSIKRDSKTRRHQSEAIKQLAKFVQIHTLSKQLSNTFNVQL